MGASSPPAPPDPNKVSAAQTQSNIETARNTSVLNAQNLNSPFGSTTFNFDPNAPQNQGPNTYGITVPTGQTITPSSDVMNFINQQLNLSNALAGQEMAQAGKLPTQSFDPNSIPSTSDLATQEYNAQEALMEPSFAKTKNELDVQLADRGIPIGSDIYNNAVQQFEANKTASQRALTEQSRQDAANQYQTNLSNALTQYELPYSQLGLLRGNVPPVQQPSFANQTPVGIQGTDVAGNIWQAYNSQLSAYNSQQQSQSGMLGLAGSLGSAVIGKGMSSRDFKQNIEDANPELILLKFRDLPTYNYDYKDLPKAVFNLPESRHGPMAQDYSRLFPEGQGTSSKTIDVMDAVGNLISAVKALDERTKDLAPKQDEENG